MADGLGSLPWIDADKENPNARFDTIAQHELVV
jgi:hypothetical protein